MRWPARALRAPRQQGRAGKLFAPQSKLPACLPTRCAAPRRAQLRPAPHQVPAGGRLAGAECGAGAGRGAAVAAQPGPGRPAGGRPWQVGRLLAGVAWGVCAQSIMAWGTARVWRVWDSLLCKRALEINCCKHSLLTAPGRGAGGRRADAAAQAGTCAPPDPLAAAFASRRQGGAAPIPGRGVCGRGAARAAALHC